MSCTIEVLFPEACNLFGDYGNIRYLKACLPDAEFIETPLNGVPHFVSNPVSLVYMGPMTEKTQCEVVKRLLPYHERITELIEGGTPFLITGNAMEVFGRQISDLRTGTVKCLGIFDFTVTRDMLHRFSGLVVGNYENIIMTGFRAQFTKCELGNKEKPFINITKGVSMCDSGKVEGIVKNNFYGTYLLGPILILNPDFTKYILRKITGKEVAIAFEEEVVDAYRTRLAEFNDRHTKIS
ncbi:MAG: hypothetical protein ACI4JB_05960 [Porcipelethomonas sp.]